MKQLISPKETIFATVISVVIVFVISFIFAGAGASVLTPQHSFGLNVFYANLTFMGDSIFSFALVATLLFFNRRNTAIQLLFSILVTLFITQLIKNIFTGEQPPQLFFENNTYYFDPQIPVNIISSHAACAFTLFFFFIGYFKNRWVQLTLLSLTLLIAYSRIYAASDSIFAVIFAIVPASVSMIMLYSISTGHNNNAFIKRRKHAPSSQDVYAV